MAGQIVIKIDDKEFIPLRYDNFAALGAEIIPTKPCIAVPLYRDIANAVKEARTAVKQFEDSIPAQGVPGAGTVDLGGDWTPTYEDKLKFPFLMFRGERNKRYGIMPTRYRFAGQPDLPRITRGRIEFEAKCAAQVKRYLACHTSAEVTDEQARAASRHYGAPSSFVDFSFNPEVAAFFGHPKFIGEKCAPNVKIGTLYGLGINHFQSLFGIQAWVITPDGGRDIHCVNVESAWQIPYLSFNPATKTLEQATLTVPVPEVIRAVSVRTRVVPAISRITAQEGIFLEANFEEPEDWWAQVFMWTILDFFAHKWCFVRQDFTYENPDAGIVAEKLFPPDKLELVQLTNGFRNWE